MSYPIINPHRAIITLAANIDVITSTTNIIDAVNQIVQDYTINLR